MKARNMPNPQAGATSNPEEYVQVTGARTSP